jgi:hypothetical protein
VSNGRGRSASDFRLAFRRIRDDYTRRFERNVAEVRGTLASPERRNPDIEAALEAHVRAYVIDGMLSALRWTIVPSTPDSIENMIPEVQLDPANGPRRYMDYFGYEHEVTEPLLVVEAKRPTPFPIPPNGSTETASATVARWLANPVDAPGLWNEWIPSLQGYVATVALRTGRYPVRAAITDGNWLVVFVNPPDAFGAGGQHEARYVEVFTNAGDIDERYDVVFRLLDQRQVSRVADEIAPGAIRGVIDPTRVVSLLHGLRLVYTTTPIVGHLVPTITVMPTILLRSDNGCWLKVARQVMNQNEIRFVPNRYDDLPRHLQEVREDAERLLGRVQQQLGRSLLPSPLTTHYADDAFEAMHGLEELAHEEDHFWIVTGQATHYLLQEPTVADCPFHDFGRAVEQRCQALPLPLINPSIETPRAFFTNSQLHHCCHEDVDGSKHVHISEDNEARCGPRSGRRGDVFCEMAPVDEFLCCRTCAFQEVCTESEILRLPCNRY